MTPLVQKFTEAMWKRGAVRMVLFAGYKDEDGAWMSTWYVTNIFNIPNTFDELQL